MARLAPVLLFALALGLRLWGISWGLPHEGRLFSLHPDESMVVGNALKCYPYLFLLDPGFYNYGSLQLLIDGSVIHLAELFGLVQPGPAPTVPSASALLAARTLSALMGAAIAPLLLVIGARLWSDRAGAIAALLWTLAPLAVQHSRFATVDVPATFWVTLVFFTLSGASRRRWILAGLFCGLAAATKYNAGVVLLAPMLAAWQEAVDKKARAKALLTIALSAAGGFLLGCPAIVLNPGGVLSGIAYEAAHVKSGHGLVFAATLPAPLHHWLENLACGIGSWGALIAFGGLLLALIRREPGERWLLAFTLPYFLLISLGEVKFARYVLPLLPALCLFYGRAAVHAFGKRAELSLCLGVIGLLWAGVSTVVLTLPLSQPDPRLSAAAYLREKGIRSVGFATGPWFYSPTLAPGLANPIPPLAKKSAVEESSVRLIPAEGEWNVEQLKETDPDAVAIADLNEYGDALRARHPPALAYLDELRHRYPVKKTFAPPAGFLAKKAGVLGYASSHPDLRIPRLPHDMLYPLPTITVWTKR